MGAFSQTLIQMSLSVYRNIVYEGEKYQEF